MGIRNQVFGVSKMPFSHTRRPQKQRLLAQERKNLVSLQEAPWSLSGAARNVIVHDYLDVDLAQIWDIVERDLPNLKRAVAAMLEEQP